ncbi:ABC transporter ATP-binding protein [Dactylosporangium fulvum]|uniref:ABC transporter ATP-binding protein n=1 Tax=Dactylosporangium fulvum TaxID=53359 RepID=A0ABY5VQE9_9ACTN|nr:ABC transporter ATP-binding protein [Dactylosporangium fulvum]UWP79750.1 ABC transporter ATP-binding protein [Dactylosporangium fulvum]
MSLPVRIHQLEVAYGGRKQDAVVAVNGVDIEIGSGEFGVLLGPSGCGKSTVLNTIAGLISPTAGTITVGDQVFFDKSRDINLKPEKRGLGMVFQSYALWPHMTVFDNVAFPLRRRHVKREQIASRVGEMLELVRCQQYAKRYPHELSGGQQQRIALARTLVGKPAVVLFDEPLSNLDAELRIQLRDELALLHSEIAFTAVYVTHDQAEAYGLASKLFVLRDGRVEQTGPPLNVYHAPATEYVASFLGANSWAGEIVGREGKRLVVDSEYGIIESTSDPKGLGVGDTAVVAAYPDRIGLQRDPSGAGVVVSKRFGGAAMEIVVALGPANDDRLRIRRAADLVDVHEGDRVRLVVDPADALVYAGRPTHASDREHRPVPLDVQS